MKTVLIGGGSGSGKTLLASRLVHIYDRAAILHLDCYYRDRPHDAGTTVDSGNFDHPDALDLSLILEHVRCLRASAKINPPAYDFEKHSRCGSSLAISTSELLVVEGILALYFLELRALADLRVFVDAGDSVRLARRLERDTLERGRSRDDVFRQYERTVRPMYRQYVEPSRMFADVVVSGEGDSETSARLIAAALESEY